MKTNDLWKQRFGEFLKTVRTYGKYVFNDHIRIVLIFAVGVGAYYYQQWLATLTPSFPTVPVFALIFALLLTRGSVQTLLKQPDLVFLLPLEEEMRPYFAKAFRFSYSVQLYIFIAVGAALAPLYFQQMKQPVFAYVLIIVLILLAKLWNLLAVWEVMYTTDDKVRVYDWMLRFGVNLLFVYFIVGKMSVVYIGAVVVVMIVYIVLLRGKAKGKSLPWERLIHEEGKKMMLFYRVANMFTDVPALKGRVQRRVWLDPIAALVPFSQRHSYSYLYVRTFLRTGDYFGLVLRLVVIGGLIMYFIPFLYGKLIVGALSIYIIGYQLLSLYNHHRAQFLLELYPIQAEQKKRAFLSLLMIILMTSSIVYTAVLIAALQKWDMALLALGLHVLVSYVFTYVYSKKKLDALL